MASDSPLPSSGGQRRPPDEEPSIRRLLAVVRRREERWVFEFGGESEVAGETQLDAQLAAARHLAERGGGELLIRDAEGRQAKRIVVEPAKNLRAGTSSRAGL